MENSILEEISLEPVIRLSKDLKKIATHISDQEARYLIKTYYQIQRYRIAVANQIRSLEDTSHELSDWIYSNMKILEAQIKRALDSYTDANQVGRWAKSNKGIGPVTAAGLLAYIDITKAPTVGHIWSYAGLNPTVKWEKGQKRPWNAELKTICWKIGQSFVKVSNKPDAFYGQIYKERKEYETKKNEDLKYKEQAIIKLKNISKNTGAYKYYSEGKLPPAHIEARAERYAVKIFLSHLHYVWYKEYYGEEPPKPFAIEHLGHAHIIKVPNY